MQRHIHDLQQTLLISDLQELKLRAAQLIRIAGFKHHMYAFSQPCKDGAHSKILPLFTDYPADWLSSYIRKQFFKFDPMVAHCDGPNFHPLLWSQARFLQHYPEFAEESASFGLSAGWCFPLRDHMGRRAGWSFMVDTSSKEQEDILQHELPWTQLLCIYLHDAFQRLAATTASPVFTELTARELECLTWFAAGKTAWEVGRILSISEWTVTYHMRNIKRKLGVQTRTQTVARAISLGLVKP